MPRREKELLARDAKRNIGEELLQAIRYVKAGRHGAKYKVQANDIVAARLKSGLSQAQFAAALKISPRTLQQREQGRRQPSGAAETLLKIVARHPEVLREVMAATLTRPAVQAGALLRKGRRLEGFQNSWVKRAMMSGTDLDVRRRTRVMAVVGHRR